MTWTASLVSYDRDPNFAAVAVAVVDFTDGTHTDRQSFRGISTREQLNRCIRDQITVHETIDALKADLVVGAIDPYAPVLSNEQVAGIRALVTDWTPSNDEIAAALNAMTVPNPVPQGKVPAPLTVASIIGLLSPAAVGALSRNPNTSTIRDDIRKQDREAVVTWATALTAAGDVTPDELAKVEAAVQTTIDDPAWQATIPTLSAILGRPATAADIAVVRS